MEIPTASLVYDVLDLMPTGHQRASLTALLSLFLMADCCTPKDSKTNSESGLSRFLNIYGWPTRKVVATIRLKIERFINAYYRMRRGRRPILHAIVDLTCLEKTGQYKGLEECVRVYNGKRGVHVAMTLLANMLLIHYMRISVVLSLPLLLKVEQYNTHQLPNG